MLQFLLSVAGGMSMMLIILGIHIGHEDSFVKGFAFTAVGLMSFVTCILLTNWVFP